MRHASRFLAVLAGWIAKFAYCLQRVARRLHGAANMLQPTQKLTSAEWRAKYFPASSSEEETAELSNHGVKYNA